jgi:hypothetical protein
LVEQDLRDWMDWQDGLEWIIEDLGVKKQENGGVIT